MKLTVGGRGILNCIINGRPLFKFKFYFINYKLNLCFLVVGDPTLPLHRLHPDVHLSPVLHQSVQAAHRRIDHGHLRLPHLHRHHRRRCSANTRRTLEHGRGLVICLLFFPTSIRISPFI